MNACPTPSPANSSRRLAAVAGLALVTLGAACGPTLALAQGHEPPTLQGRWITASGNLEVDIAPCGDALCGRVTREMACRSMEHEGEPMRPVDGRPAEGMQIISNLRPVDRADPTDDTLAADRPAQWDGTIYNRENGRHYRVQVSADAAGRLVVRPYVGLPLFGRTQIWARPQTEVAGAASGTPAATPAATSADQIIIQAPSAGRQP